MARPRNISKVQMPPRVKGFIPMGYYGEDHEPVTLNIEEYESLRLLDYENLSQEDAAGYMHVSRPTLTRIYERARRKVAKALTECHQILIEGGNAMYNGIWYECADCLCKFNNPDNSEFINCVLCDSKNIRKL